MPLKVEGNRVEVLSTVNSSNVMGSIRRARELSDIAPQYIAKSGLCKAREVESSKWGNIKIQHVTGGTSSSSEGKSRFPKLDECAHFHYEHVEIGPLQVTIIDDDGLKPLSSESEEGKWWSLNVVSQDKSWLIRRSYDNFKMLDQQLHRCIYDRKFSELNELPDECIEEQENIHKLLSDYMKRFSAIAGNIINCGPILNWLELDNRGHRLLVPDNDSYPINTPAVAAAYSVKRYTAQAPDEISFEVGDMISVIDMPPPEESIWWRGKRGFQVGFFPCECVAIIGDKIPRNFHFSSQTPHPTKPVLRKHGKLISFFRSFILSRPSRRRLKQSGILKERVFGCDLGEHLLNSGHEIPMVLKCCVEFIETNGLIDGIYRLSGVTSNIQRLRNTFDEDRVPGLYEDEAILQDVHSVASLLKMYFRELPNPLCTYQLYYQFVGAIQTTEADDARLMKMRDVVQKLPPPHYRTLEYLMRHLSRVSEKGHETGMTCRNIAIVWAPNLLRCKELEVGGVAALQGVGVQAVVTEFLVCYADLIFSDNLPNFGISAQGSTKKSRPKSLAISTPTKLLSLEEARTRALLQTSGKAEPDYIEVGGGPANLPAKYHTVIELPGYSRKRLGSKRSPIGWKSLFGKSGRNSQARKEMDSKVSPCTLTPFSNKTVTDSALVQLRRPLRPAKSAESLSSSRNSPTVDLSDLSPKGHVGSNQNPSLGPFLLRSCEGKNGGGGGGGGGGSGSGGHNRSVSHESYFDQYHDQKENFMLDMNEIQVNFDLEESEMRIFSEDETVLSTRSGSLASLKGSPRILSSHKLGKLTGTSVKRMSYPKLADSSESPHNADPSPKKQKTNDENCPKSKLEEQLSNSVGDIQFIDSVSPDQGLSQSEVHPIRSPSSVSSLSQIASCLLPPSSPILPHIPHLGKAVYETLKSSDAVVDGSTSDPNNQERFLPDPADCNSVQLMATCTKNLPRLSYSDQVDDRNVEETNRETVTCAAYTPLIEYEESTVSDVTTPDVDTSASIRNSSSDNLDTPTIKSCSELDRFAGTGTGLGKPNEKTSSERESGNEPSSEATPPRVEAPKPMERKPKAVHPYVNIPLVNSFSVGKEKLLETSFELEETRESESNRNSGLSIKYECISTESSCDSLINVNRDEDKTLLLGLQSKEDNLLAEESRHNCNSAKKYSTKISPSIDLSETGGLGEQNNSETPGKVSSCGEGSMENQQELNLSTSYYSGHGSEEKVCGNAAEPWGAERGFSAFPGEPLMQEEESRKAGGQIEESHDGGQGQISGSFNEQKKREGCLLETDLDAVLDAGVPAVGSRSLGEDGGRSPTNFEDGHIQGWCSTLEACPPTATADPLDSASFIPKRGKEEIEKKEISFRENSDDRPKTLERLCTRRKTTADPFEGEKIQLGKSKSGSQINEKKSGESDKLDYLLNCELDLSDPQRRERIERYKEKRRNYLREKYKSDSFKSEKSEFPHEGIKQKHVRKKDWESLEGSSSPDKGVTSSEKKGKGPGTRLWKEPGAGGQPSGGQPPGQGPGPAHSGSPTRSAARKANFLRSSNGRKVVVEGEAEPANQRTNEKKSIFPDFSRGGPSKRDGQAGRKTTKKKGEGGSGCTGGRGWTSRAIRGEGADPGNADPGHKPAKLYLSSV